VGRAALSAALIGQTGHRGAERQTELRTGDRTYFSAVFTRPDVWRMFHSVSVTICVVFLIRLAREQLRLSDINCVFCLWPIRCRPTFLVYYDIICYCCDLLCMMIDEIRCHTLTTINFSITRTDSAWAKLGCHWLPLTYIHAHTAHSRRGNIKATCLQSQP